MIKKLLILLVTVTIVYGAYEYYKIRVKGYPVKTYLLSNQYRLLPVIIKGRTNTHIHFSHRNKNQLYFYQIDNLHLVSRLQIKLYPLHSQLSNISHSNRDPVISNQTQTNEVFHCGYLHFFILCFDRFWYLQIKKRIFSIFMIW